MTDNNNMQRSMMRSIFSWLLASVLLASVGSAIGSTAAYAQDALQQAASGLNEAQQTAAQAKLPADVRVVIDVSGSMKQNDPSNLRQPALELLVQLLQDDSRAGVWTFGRYINMLVPHKPVTGRWREDANRKAAEINSVGLFTNIGEALEKAAYDHDRPNPNYRTSLILLTDGMVDISRDPAENEKEWRRIVDEVLPKLRDAGYVVHTIALSDNADQTLLNKLALQTDGIAAVAKNADELMKIFLQAFDQAAPAEQVPLEGNSFIIDSSIEEFTALIFRSPGSDQTRLISPDDTEYSFDKEVEDVNWYRAEAYDLITVQRPLEGEWQVIADMDPDSRVTVVSNLNLLVKPLKSNLFKGDQLDVSLLFQDNGKTITRSDFLQLLDIDSSVEHGESQQVWRERISDGAVPSNGIYSTTLTMFEDEGRYQLEIDVDGKSFKRRFSHGVSVREPFGVTKEKVLRDGRTYYQINVETFSQFVDPQNLQVVARIKDPRGRSSIKPFSLNASDIWSLELAPEIEGTYDVRLRISGEDNSGSTFDVDPQPMTITYPDEDNPFASEPEREPVVETVVEPKPKPKPEPKPEPQPEPEPVPETVVEEEGSSSWPLYVGLAVGNLLILVLAFFAYRMIMGSGDGDSLKDLEEAVEASEQVNTEPEPEAPVAEEPTDEPMMEEVSAAEPELDPAEETIEPIEMDEPAPADELPGADEALADNLMDEELDLSTDASAEADLMAADEDVAAEAEDLLAELGMGDDEMADAGGDDSFSLDDFAPDNMDDGEDEENKS